MEKWKHRGVVCSLVFYQRDTSKGGSKNRRDLLFTLPLSLHCKVYEYQSNYRFSLNFNCTVVEFFAIADQVLLSKEDYSEQSVPGKPVSPPCPSRSPIDHAGQKPGEIWSN